MDEDLNPLVMAREQLDQVAERIHLEADVHERLKHCKRILTVAVPTGMDDGSLRVFTGYRVHHNLARGPAKAAPLPSGREPGRGERPGHVDDLEVCADGHSLWQGQGWDGLQPQGNEPAGA